MYKSSSGSKRSSRLGRYSHSSEEEGQERTSKSSKSKSKSRSKSRSPRSSTKRKTSYDDTEYVRGGVAVASSTTAAKSRTPPPPRSPEIPLPYKVLCVSSIYSKCSDKEVTDTLYKEFEKWDDVSVKLILEEERLAYIYFRSQEDARQAKREKQQKVVIGGRSVVIEAAYESADVSSSYKDHQQRRKSFDRGDMRSHYQPQQRYYPHHYYPHHQPHRMGYHPYMRGGYHQPRFAHYPGQNNHGQMPTKHYPTYLNPEEDPRCSRTLFAGNLELNITEEEIKRIFGKYGEVEDIDIKRPPPGSGNAFAFIRFTNMDQAIKAKVELSGQYIGKFQVKVGFGRTPPSQKIWVGGLGPGTTLSLLEKEFDRYGSIKKIEFAKGDTEAHITFDSIDAAQAACKDMRGQPLGGTDNRIRTDFGGKPDTPPYPRRYYDRDDDDRERSRSRRNRSHSRSSRSPKNRSRSRSLEREERSRGRKSGEEEYRRNEGSLRSGDEGYKRGGNRGRSPGGLDRDRGPRGSGGSTGGRGRSPDYTRGSELRKKIDEGELLGGENAEPENHSPPHDVIPKTPPHPPTTTTTTSRRIKNDDGDEVEARSNDSFSLSEAESEDPIEKRFKSLAKARNLTELSRRAGEIWNGPMYLKNSVFLCKLYALEGDWSELEDLFIDDDGSSQMKITQRLRQDKSKLDDVQARFEAATSTGIFLILPSSECEDNEFGDTRTNEEHQQRSLDNLVSYLKKKEAAGVIPAPGKNSGTGVLYAFPPSEFVIEKLRSIANHLDIEELENSFYLVLFAIKGIP